MLDNETKQKMLIPMLDRAIERLAEKIVDEFSDYDTTLQEFNKESSVIDLNDWNLYSLTIDREKMFIMQNPGVGKKDESQIDEQRKRVIKWQEHKSSERLETAIKSMQKGLIKWLTKYNMHFWKFFEILSKEKIIQHRIVNKSEYENYIKNHFLEDFYVTDLFKYRVPTTKLGSALYGKNVEKQEFRKKLMKVLEEYELKQVKPKLVFVFSTRTWETFYTYFDKKIEPIGKELEEDTRDFLKKVTNVHGLTFKLTIFGNEKEIIVIPLCHFSPRYYNNLIRSSYFRYFKERLVDNREIIQRYSASS